MAKRKLSAEQRAKLRAELAEAVKAKRKTSEVLAETSKKYGISTITVRWYLSSLGGKRRKQAGRRGAGRPRKQTVISNGDPSARLKSLKIQMVAAKAAVRLTPRLERLDAKEADIRRTIAKLERSLKVTSKKAKKLREEIAELELTSG